MSDLPARWVPASSIRTEVETAVRELDLERAAAGLDAQPSFPREIFRALGARHLLGLVTPASRGGRGLAAPDAGAALYELAYASGATTFAKLSLQPEFCSLLGEHAPAAVFDREYRPLCRGERLIGNQLTEPTGGSDVRSLRTEAVPTGTAYSIRGQKSEAAFAVDAESAIVYARVPASTGHPGGITAFLVAQGSPGIERTHVPDLGERWMRRGTVVYRDVEVPGDHRLGEEGRALELVFPELHRERAMLSMVYLGLARRTLEETIAYVGGREAFGGPLARLEGVSFPLVEAWAELEAATLYAREVLARRATGSDMAAEAALAKWMATTVSLRVHDHAIQFHGGRGYSSALPYERRWRDVRSGALAHGPSEAMHVAAARVLWGRSSGSGGPGGPEKRA